MTAIPLLLFGASVTRVPLTTIGLMQYITPVLQFLIGWLVLGEAMPATRWVGFALVWSALARADLGRPARRAPRGPSGRAGARRGARRTGVNAPPRAGIRPVAATARAAAAAPGARGRGRRRPARPSGAAITGLHSISATSGCASASAPRRTTSVRQRGDVARRRAAVAVEQRERAQRADASCRVARRSSGVEPDRAVAEQLGRSPAGRARRPPDRTSGRRRRRRASRRRASPSPGRRTRSASSPARAHARGACPRPRAPRRRRPCSPSAHGAGVACGARAPARRAFSATGTPIARGRAAAAGGAARRSAAAAARCRSRRAAPRPRRAPASPRRAPARRR